MDAQTFDPNCDTADDWTSSTVNCLTSSASYFNDWVPIVKIEVTHYVINQVLLGPTCSQQQLSRSGLQFFGLDNTNKVLSCISGERFQAR